jgi:hypothetical protein
MASGNEIILSFINQYKSMLKDIEIFGTRFPNSKDEYNFFVDMAADLLNTANTLGLSSLPPLPAKK